MKELLAGAKSTNRSGRRDFHFCRIGVQSRFICDLISSLAVIVWMLMGASHLHEQPERPEACLPDSGYPGDERGPQLANEGA